jgi:hypothetical protein
MFYQASRILVNPKFPYTGLVIAIVVGMPLILATIFAVFILRRRYTRFFIGKEKEVEEFKES